MNTSIAKPDTLVGVALAPLVWMVSASLMPTGQASTFPPPFLPREVTFEHYLSLFTRMNISRYLFNSTFLAIAGSSDDSPRYTCRIASTSSSLPASFSR